MLYLIGIGLKKGDITLGAIDAIKQCEKIYAEQYTGATKIDYIKNETGKNIDILDREKIEGDFIINKSRHKNIALLIPGDPLTATTHIELILEAKKLGIKTKITHAPSIFTAIAESGLQIYKFGRTTTLARPQPNYNPESPYDIVVENKKSNLHTLMLLEIDMSTQEAIKILTKIDEKKKKGIMKNNIVGLQFGNITKIKYSDPLSIDLKPPCCLIFPGNLHFKEEEALALWE